MKISSLSALLLVTGLLSACSGSDGGPSGSPAFSSSLPDSTVIASLSSTDSNKLCQELNASALFSVVLDSACLQQALFATSVKMPKTDAEARDSCASIYNTCRTKPVMNVPCDTASCQATIGQFESCTNALIGAYEDQKSMLPKCTELTLAVLAKVDFDEKDASEPASCKALGENCL